MKKTCLAGALVAILASSAGTAFAGSDEHRAGYWKHGSKERRDRGADSYDGNGWKDSKFEEWLEARRDGEHWRDWWRRHRDRLDAGDDTADAADEEPVDTASDGHVGESE